jgi:hypothetical protein
MKFQTTKAHTIDVRHNLPFSMLHRKQFIFIKNTPIENLSALFQGLFKIFSHKENKSINNEKMPDEFADKVKVIKKEDNETRSLQQLENCANAARKTEAYDQYEWFN